MTRPIRVLLIDDHRMFRELVDMMLQGEPGIELVADASTGEEGLEQLSPCPDVAIIDVDLPGMDGVQATRRMLERCPRTRVVIVTALQERDVMARAIEAGASGLLPKTHAGDDLIDVIKRIASGETLLPSEDLNAVMTSLRQARSARSEAQATLGNLTSREIQVLQAMADGKSNTEVADALFISPVTVQGHMRRVLRKLGVRSRLEAVALALRHGAIRPPRDG
jgi:DNA-binding NarL/FixJ family response regulator